MELQILLFTLGLCIGSFLNVCIHRIPLKKSILWGASHCPSCHRPLLWRHKMPLVSYIFLKGRCFWCQAKISWQYPLVESLTGLIFFILYAKYGLSQEFVIYVCLSLLLTVVAGIDIQTLRIPNTLIIFGCALWLTMNLFLLPDLSNGLIGGAAGSGILLLVVIFGKIMFKKESMGGGDVKLAGLIGLFLGAEGIVFTLGWAVFLGGVIALIGLLSGILKRESKLPFGLFLAVGAFIYLIVDSEIYMAKFASVLMGY